ncbi:UbiX family flavin prenyltransferase [Candidatus Alkanophaga liquidiphilum]|nr:Flavin prenyltransferase UbiX [Candidatus Alkanophaga liquidiphilum]RLG37754.1 MAG: aromatic acid decarboxylase [Candidatus Alkanophagales archaeon]
MRIVVAITGASGVIYGIRLLEVLKERAETILIVSNTAKKLIPLETGFKIEDVYGLASRVYENAELTAEVSSGTAKYDGTAVVPCSMKTLGCIAAGISATLITRVAEVCLKEGRRLVLVPRETPLSTVHLENMLALRRAGAIILPACPAFYHEPKSTSDLVDFIVMKVLDALGMENELVPRWGTELQSKQS